MNFCNNDIEITEEAVQEAEDRIARVLGKIKESSRKKKEQVEGEESQHEEGKSASIALRILMKILYGASSIY